MNRRLKRYLDDVRANLEGVAPADRDAALAEMKAHLEEKIGSLTAKGLSVDEATIKATHDFGEPSEIGIAYGPKGGVVHQSTGKVLLRVALSTGRAAGKGLRGLAKVLGISALVLVGVAVALLVAGLFFAGTVLHVFGDDIREAVPRPVYYYGEEWSAPAVETGTQTDSFQIGPDVKEFRILIETDPDLGCVRIELVAPDDEVSELNGNGCDAAASMTTHVQQGTWRVRYTFIGYAGTVEVEAYAFEHA